MRVHRERAAEGFERELILAELLHDDAEARQRPEMTWLARQHLADIAERLAEILGGEIKRRAPVPGFDILGLETNDRAEQLDRKIVVLALDRSLHPAHQQVSGVAAGGKPKRPDASFDQLGAVRVRRRFQRL